MTHDTDTIRSYELDDRYELAEGRVFLTGTQALTRILLDQARRDRAAGLGTRGFVSGYRGSPLGGLDRELWRASDRLAAAGIEFLPAVNEDLAATAVLGSQQVETNSDAECDGVFALWYGKGPGVDRAGDALKHGNAYGSSPHGGVLVVAGDDHGCVSSSMPHQSDVAFMAWFMPVLNPANLAEYLAFGEYGYALSRYSGMWVGFKAISETVESAGSVELRPDRRFVIPQHQIPPGGLHYRWPDLPGPQIEERIQAKKDATFAFAEANPIDRAIYGIANARFGIVTTGKGHLDTMEALRLLGLEERRCRALGIDIYKVGMVWPLPRRAALDFVRGKEEILVIEEKRGIIESQFKEYFYDWPGDKPERMVGKHDETLTRLIPWTGELSPRQLVPLIAGRLEELFPGQGIARRAHELGGAAPPAITVPGAVRTPYFCSGCPHNSSTKLPEGSQALAGIGCHFMASWMDRNTTSLIQMGGEGVNWAASSIFTGRGHVFQNLGEGTWYHSGSMAVRQAIAAGTNITYKILYNDAVAMTGGQPVDGPVSVPSIAHSVRAEGVARIAVLSSDPGRLRTADLPDGTTLHDRAELDAVQRELREVPGVSVLIYDQTCASELRRRRKRGLAEDPPVFAVINELVCEGCGDCSVESNCLSVEPVETEFGRKRRINLSSCNKDFSCLNGFCPSFVTVEGVRRRRTTGGALDPLAAAGELELPRLDSLAEPYDLLVTGVGGTGVVTVGALITMAAHLQGLGASVLDFTGFAQKFGPVLSFVRLAVAPADLHQLRIDRTAARAVIGCDIVVSSSERASSTYNDTTRVVLNRAEMPTGDVVLRRDADLRVDDRQRAIAAVVGPGNVSALNANAAAERYLGDAVFANVIMLGFAWQQGLVPIGLEALERAIVLNGIAVEPNRKALALGRVLAERPELLEQRSCGPERPETVEEIITRRAEFLAGYQDEAYARRYRDRLRDFSQALPGAAPEELLATAARSLFKLMAYKDEYEVARLMTAPEFRTALDEGFEEGYRLRYHLAPPVLPTGRDARGRPKKRAFGRGTSLAFRLLARLKRLRGSWADPFGYQIERREERALIGWYEALMGDCATRFAELPPQSWREVLEAPLQIRGYGPVKTAAMAEAKARVAKLMAGPR